MKKTSIFRSATAILLSLILMFSALSITVSAAGTVTVTFNATVEGGIPAGAKVSIGSALNGWNPKDTGWYATQIDETHFRITASVSSDYVGQTVEYKWTLQRSENESGNGWEYSESTGGSSGGFSNRTITIKESGNEVNDTVVFPDEAIKIDETLTRGTLDLVEMEMPQFSDGRTRTIRVWLPDGYNANDTGKKYSVLYMHDGQNLFDASTSFLGEWQVDESLSELMDKGYESTIVVGIDNGSDKRFNELSPSWDLSSLGKNYITAPEGEKYAQFIVETVKPYIDEHYNTLTDRAHTGIGGSSMGGIMSLYMAMEYADVFDYGLVLSPALHVYNDYVLDKFFDSYDFSAMSHLPKIYLFAGGTTAGSDPGSAYDEACITKYVDIVKNELTDRGYPEQIIGTLVDESLCHLESTWATIFPKALEWLSSVTEPVYTNPTTNPTTEPTTEPAKKYLIGDVNLDEEINVKDATLIQRIAVEDESLVINNVQRTLADVNGDEDVNVKDATCILLYTVESLTGTGKAGQVYEVSEPSSTETQPEPSSTDVQPSTDESSVPDETTTDDTTAPAGDQYRVAGVSALCGSNWDATDDANLMAYNESTACYEKVYTGVAAGEYEYKITMNGSTWIPDGWGNNCKVTVETDNSTVTIRYDATSNTWGADVAGGESDKTEPDTSKPDTTQPSTQSSDSYTLYYKNSSFSEPYAFYWSSTDVSMSTWPGVKMDSVGNDVYKVTVPSTAEYIIFSDNGDNTTQTGNLDIPGDNQIYDNGSWRAYN